MRHPVLSLIFIGILCPWATAAPTLSVELGWDGIFRAGHWGPMFITVSDSTPRTAQIELYCGHDELHAMRIRQIVTLNPQPTTYVLYVPLQNWGPELSVVLRDTRRPYRRLADWALIDPGQAQRFYPLHHVIAVSGRPGAERFIEKHIDLEEFKVPFIDPLRLPSVATGYDSLDVLMLNQPDLSRIAIEQQEAMIDWVRAGGHLICWLGEQPPPASSPILDALPAMIGENVAIQLSDGALRNAGLADRFRNLKGRNLAANPGSTPIPLFGDSVRGWRRELGLGAISLLPADVSTLLFDSPEQSRQFWQPILGSTVLLQKSQTPFPTQPGGYVPPSYEMAENQRRSEASNQAMNMLGDVPGGGDFGFGYVALVMIGMMLVVGPVDWIVLKRLGRQPWTWITTSGWIALITLGAVYIGYIFKSGDLHYRTLRLIDQVDTTTVATVDVAGIYSPRTREYQLSVGKEGWWEPLTSVNSYYYGGGRALVDLDFHQDYQGNRPDPMVINVWNLRFLMSNTTSPAPPMIEASLRRELRQSGRDALVGTIKNVGTVPLKSFSARTKLGRGVISKETLAPGATLQVDLLLSRYARTPTDGRSGQYIRPPTIGPEVLYDLAYDRSIQFDRLLEGSAPFVCIYAEIDNPAAQVTLTPAPTIERHFGYVRAIFPLEETPP